MQTDTCRTPGDETTLRTGRGRSPWSLRSRPRYDITPMMIPELYIRTFVRSWLKSVMSRHVQNCDARDGGLNFWPSERDVGIAHSDCRFRGSA